MVALYGVVGTLYGVEGSTVWGVCMEWLIAVALYMWLVVVVVWVVDNSSTV